MIEEHPIVSVLRKHLDVKVTVTDPFEIEKGMLRRFAIATGDTDPIYHDEDYARASQFGEIISPPTFPFEWNHHEHGVAQLDISGDIFKVIIVDGYMDVKSKSYTHSCLPFLGSLT